MFNQQYCIVSFIFSKILFLFLFKLTEIFFYTYFLVLATHNHLCFTEKMDNAMKHLSFSGHHTLKLISFLASELWHLF